MSVQPTEHWRRHEKIVTRQILGETLLVPISADVADMDNIFALNETGAWLWQRLDGTRTLATLSTGLSETFEVSTDQAWCDVEALVSELAEAGLVSAVESP